MIYDFALEPELVATWHDRRVAYPLLCQMGLGHRRVPCTYPVASWRNRVMAALEEDISGLEIARQQTARRNLDVLARHLEQSATRRSGRVEPPDSWLQAAVREHGEFPFGGILVREATNGHPAVVSAHHLPDQQPPTWSPAAEPTLRQPEDMARALAPLLRACRDLRFVDPYFDVTDAGSFEPMRAYLAAAQRRRGVGDLQVQVHFSVRPEQIEQESRLARRQLRESEVGEGRVVACERLLAPLVNRAVRVQACVWAQGPAGVRMHNRYVLTEVGGVAIQTGLDRAPAGSRQTDDLTVLSKEQLALRLQEYSPAGVAFRRVSHRAFAGASS